MKISISIPEELAKSIDSVINQPNSIITNRSNLVAVAIKEFLTRNFPELYLNSTRAKAIKPTVLSYLKTIPDERFKMRSPKLRGRRIHAEWVEIK